MMKEGSMLTEYAERANGEVIRACGPSGFGSQGLDPYRYEEGNHCVHSECDALITDGARTCKRHMNWYRHEIRAKVDLVCARARARRQESGHADES